MKTAEEILKQKDKDTVWVTPDTTVHDTLSVMLDNNIGSILIKNGEKFVGIWTERDLMRNTVSSNFDPKKAKVGNLMTTGLFTAPHTDTIYNLLDKFLGQRIRHLLIEKEGKIIGLLSIGDVVRAALIDKTEELQKLNAIVSWEYYENWHWPRKK